MAKKLSYDQKRNREAYASRAKKVSTFHKFSFDALKLARSGKLTPSQKAAITRQYNQSREDRRQLKKQRVVFVPVKSRYRIARAVLSGSAVRKTNRGVFVSVNQGQIEKSGIDRLRVRVTRGGGVRIRYGVTDVETVAIDPVKFAKNPGAYIQAEMKRRKATAVSVVINGWEVRGASSDKQAERQEWMHYTNDLLERIAADMAKADSRRTKKSIREHLSEHVAFRFYYGRRVATMRPEEFHERYGEFSPEEGEDFDDLSDD